MTKPHTTLSEAVRALEIPEPEYLGGDEVYGDRINGYTKQHLINLLEAAADLVEQHEAQEPKLPTDISNRLRDVATGGDQYYTNTANSLLRAAADEIERYYGGMMNWKWNARHKDTQMAEYRAKLAEQPTLAATTPVDGCQGEIVVTENADGRALMNQWNAGAAMLLALDALEVATTPLPEDRQTVLRAQDALRAAVARPTASTTPVAEDALAATQAGDARDAARYRWLRDQDPCEQIGSFTPYAIQGQTGKYLDGIELDVAIDAAMSPTTTRSE